MDKDPKVLAAAAKEFEKFYESEIFSEIVNSFASVCELLEVQPGSFVSFYPELKRNLKSCHGVNLFKLLDERACSPVYCDNLQAANTKVLVVGGGPVGLRTAIETQLLGARVTVIEKRTSLTRNNVLHLWPWVIEDLKSLGAKHFYPRFCTGTMNHISIKRLQCILLKTALCFGVQVYGGVEFQDIVEPESETDLWRVAVKPDNHPVTMEGIDVLIGGEGKHVTVPGFRRKEFRGKLAIAITANFTNKRTTAEAIVDEISGVAFVYKQDFFNNLYDEFGIALENIVYYKDDTHYFVMTTKKHSLLDRKVLKQDLSDPIALLSQKNINKDALYEYIRDACDYCTDYQLPHLDFALNHHGDPDVALFDFTSMFASGNACHVIERKNRQLLVGLVGDGLLEPFWPTGTGIARGFLGAFDAVWMVRQWASGDMSPIEIMEERETILKILPQTSPENITKDFKNITIVPKSRYPNLPKHLYSSREVRHLYSSETPDNADLQRYLHPSFEEIVPKAILNKRRTKQPINATRILIDHSEVKKPVVVNSQTDVNANEFYKTMREKRINNMKNEKEKSEQSMIQERINGRQEYNKKPSRKEQVKEKTILNNDESKLEFLKKMSNTFGYGKPDSDDKQLKDDEKIKDRTMAQSRPHRNKATDQVKAQPTSRRPNVRSWDFSDDDIQLHSSVAPIIPELDIATDPELDCLFSSLEHDSEFSKLGENDQQAWLESLFFQDTTHLPGRIGPKDQLTQTKSNPKNTLRVNMSNGSRPRGEIEKKNRKPEEESVTAVHVNDKMKNVAQDFFKDSKKEGSKKSSNKITERMESAQAPNAHYPNSTNPKPDCQITDNTDAVLHETSGINENLTSVVEAYFQKPQIPTEDKNSNDEDQKNLDEDKTSLVASFFSPSVGNQSNSVPKPTKPKVVLKQTKPKVARIPQKPVAITVNEAYNPEEDDEIERLIRAAEKEQENLKQQRSKTPKSPPTPPTPPRSVDKKAAAIMRRLGNITEILQGKN